MGGLGPYLLSSTRNPNLKSASCAWDHNGFSSSKHTTSAQTRLEHTRLHFVKAATSPPHPSYRSPHKFRTNAQVPLRCGRLGLDGTYQLPVVALVCQLGRTWDTCLGYADVKVLLHEVGHALHSLLARTRYQHLAGTR